MIFDRLSLVLVAAAALLGVIVSGAIHEMGHAVAAHAAGMHIIEIQPWLFLGSPHVSFTGSATNGAWAGIHCAGVVAATLTGLTATAISGFLVRNGSRWGAITWLFVPFLFQPLAWVALPILLRLGANVQGDDSIKFIRASGWHPLAVSAAALVLLCLAIGLIAALYKHGRLLLVRAAAECNR